MGVTIKDVARQVGVTPATVSMVINNKPRISEETRRKVLKAIEELDYYPHEGARNLVLRRTNTVGVASTFFNSQFFLETLSGIEDEIRRTEFNLVLFGTRGLLKNEEQVIQRIARERKVDGLVTVSLSLTEKQIRYFKKNDIAVVSLEEEIDGFDSVVVDNRKGGFDAARHLIELGHKRIAIVNGAATVVSSREREAGFKKALKEAGLELRAEYQMQVHNYTRREGYDVTNELLAHKERPTAVFCAAGDVCAVGVMQACKEAGLRVPQDISVVGFDDLMFAEMVEPALTTVQQPLAKMGAQAFHLLKEAMRDPKAHQPTKLTFDTRLIVRASTAPART